VTQVDSKVAPGGTGRGTDSLRSARWLSDLGRRFIPLVAVVMIVTGVLAAAAGQDTLHDLFLPRYHHYDWWWDYFMALAFLGPLGAALIWTYPIRAGTSRRSRFALIACLGSAVAAVALLSGFALRLVR
jgi:hypothetical protein